VDSVIGLSVEDEGYREPLGQDDCFERKAESTPAMRRRSVERSHTAMIGVRGRIA